jgi:hypothetical protein
VQELISGKSVSVAADEEWHDGERRRAEIKMERVMELLLSEADNKRFAYLHDTCADNPVVNAYCDLVTALARKDVQLIYPQIVEGGTLRVSCRWSCRVVGRVVSCRVVSCRVVCRACFLMCVLGVLWCAHTAYLEYDLLQNINNMHDSSRQKFDENPEKILAITLRLLNAVTWDHNSQFTKLWCDLPARGCVLARSVLTRRGVCGGVACAIRKGQPAGNVRRQQGQRGVVQSEDAVPAGSFPDVTPHAILPRHRHLARTGHDTQHTTAHARHTQHSPPHARTHTQETTTSPTPLSGWYYWRSVGTMAWDAYSLVHVPRERELIYLNSENGRTLVSLQSALAAAVSKLHSPSAASLDSWQFPTPPSANTALQSSSLVQLSPYHQNIERIGWYTLFSFYFSRFASSSFVLTHGLLAGPLARPSLRYYAGQVSVHELRQNRQYKWQVRVRCVRCVRCACAF